MCYMLLSKVPKAMNESMDHIQRNLLWEGQGHKSLHLMNWNEVLKRKWGGGLGLVALILRIRPCWLNGGQGW